MPNRAQTQRDAAPAFSSHQSVVLGVYVVVVIGLARRTKSRSTRNRPALAPSRYRTDKYRSRGPWRGGRPRIAPETRQPSLKFGLDCAPSPITFRVLSLHRLAVFARFARAVAVKPSRRKSWARPGGLWGLTAQRGPSRRLPCHEWRHLPSRNPRQASAERPQKECSLQPLKPLDKQPPI